MKEKIIKEKIYKRGPYKKRLENKIQEENSNDNTDGKPLAQTLRIVKYLIRDHFNESKNRLRILEILGQLIESLDKKLKRQGLESIRDHFKESKNRLRILEILGQLIESLDKKLKRQGLESTSNTENRRQLTENILENESSYWVFIELEEYLLLDSLLNDDQINDQVIIHDGNTD